MIYKNYNITYASGFILCLYYIPKLYYKYWQKQELLNPYSKHSKFYTSNNLNTYKRQSPSPFIFEKSFQFIGAPDQIGMSIFTHTTIHQNTPFVFATSSASCPKWPRCGKTNHIKSSKTP